MLLGAILLGLMAGAATSPEMPPVEKATSQVRQLLREQHWVEAMDRARQLHAEFPGQVEVRTVLAETLFRAGRLAEAQDVLSQVDLENPDTPGRAFLALARLAAAKGEAGRAAELAREAVRRSPDDATLLFRAAGVAGTRAEAIQLLEAYLEIPEGEPEERIESAKGSLRLSKALGDTRIWTSVRRPERVELPLTPLWVPETGQVVGFVIKVRLGTKNKPVPLLLDSGSPGLFVVERIAKKRGFEPLAQITVFGGGGSGRHAARRGFFPSIAVGELEFSNVLTSVSRQDVDSVGRFHGLIGLSAFNGYRVTIDLKRRRLILDRQAPELGGAPYFTVGGQMLIQAETTGEREGLFLFDTGATHTLVSHDLVGDTPGVTSSAPTAVPAFGGSRRGARVLQGFEVRFQELSTGLANLRAVDLSMRSAVSGIEISGFLGLDLLDGARIEVDTVGRTVRVQAVTGKGDKRRR